MSEKMNSQKKHITWLPIQEMAPQLIRTYAHNLDKKDWHRGKYPKRLVETYEFEFILESDGYMNLEDQRYALKPGDLCLRRPGEITMGEPPYTCYMISFAMRPRDLDQKIQPLYQNDVLDRLGPVTPIKNIKYYELLFAKILELYIKNDDAFELMTRALILEIIYAAYQDVKRNYLPSSAYNRPIQAAIKFIETYYHEKLSLSQIASYAGLSPAHFQKIFTETMNVSPTVYLQNHRMSKAKELLLISNLSITDIVYQSGFESNAYFSYVFKKNMHMSPTDYRKLHLKP
jgi:AraC-like DNA-binding protein